MSIPERLGRYRVEALIGAGTFATVFRGRDEALDVPVAIKVLAQNWSYEPEIRKRFIAEAKLLRRADGTRLVRVHDIGETSDGQPFFVMDFAERGTIEDRLNELAGEGRAIQVEDVARFTRQLAGGVSEVHRLGVVHRDIKPSNLLLRGQRRGGGDSQASDDIGGRLVGIAEHLVVSDLGLARDLLGPTRLTAAVGTPGYMAPEQLDPSARLDERCDIYACTAVLHAVLTGEPPPERGLSAADLAADPAVPVPIRDLLLHGLASDPAARYESVEHWAIAVDAALHAAGGGWQCLPQSEPMITALSTLPRATPPPLTPVPVPPTPRSEVPGEGRGTRRPRRPVVIAAVAGVLLVLAAVAGGVILTRDGSSDGPGPSSTAPAGSMPGVDPQPAAEALVFDPFDVVADDDGNYFVFESSGNRVRRVDPGGSMETVAGSGSPGFSGDGGAATQAELNVPVGGDIGPDGSLYIADSFNGRIRKVTPDGTITTIAGTGESTGRALGLPATEATINPNDVAVGPDGTVYVSDGINSRVWKFSEGGDIEVAAGTGEPGYHGDGEAATEAAFTRPSALAVDEGGTLFISDPGASVVRSVSTDGTVETVAGNGRQGFSGDGGPATDASLNGADGIALGPDGSLYIADELNERVRLVDPDGNIDTLAGTGDSGFDGDGGPALEAELDAPIAVAVAADGSVLVADSMNNRIRRIDAGGEITSVAGAAEPGYRGDNNPADVVPLLGVEGIAFGPGGELYLIESSTGFIRKVDDDGVITTLALTAGPIPSHGAGSELYLNGGSGLAAGPDGVLYAATILDSLVQRIDEEGVKTVLAGNGTSGYSGDGGPAGSAQLNNPLGVAAGPDFVLIADSANLRIRKVSADGVVTTIAGSGMPTGPFEGSALDVGILQPFGVALGPDGAVYYSELSGQRVQRLGADGNVSTVAGTGQTGYSGDGGPATEATLNGPAGVAVGEDGTVFVAERDGNRVRRISPDGTISTVAGTGRAGFSGDGGPASEAELALPSYLAIGPDGALYIADTGNNRVRRVDADGTITSFAGAF
ncbi:MAG: Virginiamycin B lyase [Acidimicrobiales bacterium]|nr:MAG: hypothetical protein EDR02_14055 [Actinomycetota bacterium]MBV6509296.1 Virginiamycin B lyase [Acidimicrobiales bacterium]RIK03979.1 MAG: hypothetical protein DCC48_14835 [Acidobacteriota bacterium]